MIKYDDSALAFADRGNLPLFEKLEEFADKVSLLKPMANFVVTTNCTTNRNVRVEGKLEKEFVTFIYRFEVLERGEKLGAISCQERYRGGDRDIVYGVESFRIDKSRGHRNETQSKDIKVAMRLVKTMLVARADNEAIQLIRDKVSEGINSVYGTHYNGVKWSIDCTDEAMLYARTAYLASLRGEETVTLPVKLMSVNNPANYNTSFALYEDARYISNSYKAERGYAIQALIDGGFYVYSLADKVINRYDDFYTLPENIQGKYGMFKVLKEEEIVTTIGVKLRDGFSYVVE
jgi:hypothetical protein